ncbi:hypothetical protein HK098_007613 [Nowakowskiella sp. JEL0407]|nr:hypothetical protein HK098_007613 [Nowakowskiella sp. JEL0407]
MATERGSKGISLRRTIDHFDVITNLGEGAYGFVRLVKYKDDPNEKKYVLKYIVKNRVLQDGWIRDKALGGLIPLEVHILVQLMDHPHPNIVHLVEYFQDLDFFYIVMELHGFGMDLFDWIELKKNQTPPDAESDTITNATAITPLHEAEIKHLFRQICFSVRHLHSNGIVHRDIKDENVILDDSNHVQLIDFGSAAYIKPAKKFDTFYGTLDYAAPEVLTGHRYEGRPQDIWALGILLYTLIYKENPFYDIDEIISADLRIPFVSNEEALNMIKFILNRDVKKRPSIDEVLAHSWLVEEGGGSGGSNGGDEQKDN